MRLHVFLLAASAFAADGAIEFNREVRPILSDNCFGCHGPDATAKKIPLRLDSEAAAKSDLGGRRAVVPGDPANSAMIQRITTDKKGLRMPPLSTGHTLTETQIATLRAWITQGAKWQKHWAFLAPVRPAMPRVQQTKWPRNAVDYFILERLEKEGLEPSPEAAKETLLRRASIDITGLPPAPAEIDAFLKDRSANAYEKAADRMLASPRYGERMAIRWLDASRYADTNGYQFDGERVMWRWRDYVIESFNKNKPFDQFIIEQVAGDMLPNATLEQKMATGFNRNHRGNTEDGIVAEEYAVEYVVDRVETTSAVFMGLTMGCSRCHNHKYDPISQKEFYQFFAYFNNVPENGRAMKYGNSPPLVAAPTADQQVKLNALDTKIRNVEAALTQQAAALRKAQLDWERTLAGSAALYWSPRSLKDGGWSMENDFPGHAGKPIPTLGRLGGAALLDGKSYFEIGSAAQFDIDDRFTLSGWFRPECVDCSLLSRNGDTLRSKGFGIYLEAGKVFVTINGVWESDSTKYVTEDTIPQAQWSHIALAYDGSKMAAGHTLYINGKPAKTKVIQDNLYRPFRNAGAKFNAPFRIGGGSGPEQRFKGAVDDVYIYGRVLNVEEVESLALGESLNEIAQKPENQRSAAGKRQLRAYFFENAASPAARRQWDELNALLREKEQFQRTFPTVMVMAESPVRKDTFMLKRGQYDMPGDKVEPGLPAVLPSLPAGAPNNRLGLAKWMVDPSNPLPSRVIMNRTWQTVFGTGLVKTAEDFGQQGEWPSHPELLDWLATEFIRTGWDMKAMMKTIVTSAAYRQSSKSTPESLQRDPENRLLAHGPRSRFPAETVRDSALFAAGLLHEKQGGPSVMPYQPAGLWKELIMQDMEYVQSKAPDLYRRGLYTYWKRTVAPPMMATFDSALRETCVVRESRTNTPLQALNLMNDVTFVEAARFVAQRMMKEGGSEPESRLGYGFRLITGRMPAPNESSVLRDSLRYHQDYFASKPERVNAYLKFGDSPPDPALDARELAAYASVASLIFNLDEAITKE